MYCLRERDISNVSPIRIEVDNLWDMLTDKDIGTPVKMIKQHMDERSKRVERANIERNTQRSSVTCASSFSFSESSNDSSELYSDQSGSTDLVIDFDFLQFYGDKIDRDLIGAALPNSSPDTTHLSDVISCEINRMLSSDYDENSSMDFGIDEDSMEFFQQIFDENDPVPSNNFDLNRNTHPTPLLQCCICSQSFTSKAKLNDHINSHTINIEFECKSCLKRFSRLTDSLKHTEIEHRNDFSHSQRTIPTPVPAKPFKCSVCSKEFKRKHGLKSHMNGMHTKQIAYKCPFCTKFYYYAGPLYAHKKKCPHKMA